MSGESGTPRSDDLEKEHDDDWEWFSHSCPNAEVQRNRVLDQLIETYGLARKLERELAAALSHNALQEAQIAGLREDAERYRWLRDDARMSEIDVGEMVMVDPRRTDANFDAAIEAMREEK